MIKILIRDKINKLNYEYMAIKNIIFDFGGVIINLDIKSTYKSILELGIGEEYTSYLNRSLKAHESGAISDDILRQEFRKCSTQTITDQQIDRAWNKMLLDIPQDRIEFLKQLKQKYNLFLLSNTNAIHIDFLKYREAERFNEFENIFNNVYYSYQMKMRKPNNIIFETLLKNENLKSHETLFIDDTLEHINTANNLNINTYHLKIDQESILDLSL